MHTFAAITAFTLQYGVHLRRIGESTGLWIAYRYTVFPTLFPKFVHQVHVLIGQVIPSIVRDLLRDPHGPRSAGQHACYDVPGHSALGEMIESAEAARQQVWRLVGGVAGDAEAKILC